MREKPENVTILQIALNSSGAVYGLGSDSKIYEWQKGKHDPIWSLVANPFEAKPEDQVAI